MTASSSSKAAPSRRAEYIDGLRAIAVLSVVAFHVCRHLFDVAPDRSPVTFILSKGNHGVDLFFILSGFCLSYPTLARVRERGEATFDLARFAAHRLVRIFPPYWASIVFLLVFSVALTRLHVSFDSRSLHVDGVASVVRQIFFLDRGADENVVAPSFRYLNGSFWSLAVECRWYLLFPAALWLWIRFPRAFVALLVLSVLASELTRANIFRDSHWLAAFMLGIIAADLSVRERRVGLWAVGFGVLFALLASVVTPYSWEGGSSIPWQLTAFCVVVAADRLSIARRALSFRPLAAIGVASYSIYLVHEPLVAFADQRLELLAAQHPALHLSRVETGALAFALALAAGALFYAIAERPFVTGRLRARLVTTLERWFGAFFPAVAARTYTVAPSASETPEARAVSTATSAALALDGIGKGAARVSVFVVDER